MDAKLYCNLARSIKTARNAVIRVSSFANASLKRISTNLDVNLYLMQPPTNHPPTISTYLIFNQLRIIHPQFRPKSRYLVLTIVIEYSMVVVRARSKEEAVCRRGPHKLWLKRATIRLLSYFRSPRVSRCSNLHVVGPGSEILALYENSMASNASLKRISTNLDVNLYLMQPPTNHPPTISTYLIFNQLRIIHPQFRPKSRYLVLTIVIEYSMVVVRARSKEEAVCRRGPHKLWLKRATIRLLSYFRRFNRNLRESLLFLSGGTLGRGPWAWALGGLLPHPRVSRCSNLHVVGPGSEILALYENSMASNASLKRISTNLDVNLYLMQPPTNHPPTISTYLIFNQLRIIHPQFRPKSRMVLEFHAFSYLVLTIVIEYSMVVVRARSKEEAVCRRGPHKLWLKRATIRLLSIKEFIGLQ
ncbi:protein artichoke [Vespula squamosa]|uniref:Protein artichoke n=1 Tax=Vespula squamosa TaxID=30214 RepID=A0ABD2BVV4_VESSQ